MGHVFVITFVYLITTSGILAENTPPISVSKGAFVQLVEEIILYNSKYSLRVIVDLPSIHVPEETRTCNATKYLCSLVEHVFKVQNILADEVYSSNPYIRGNVHNGSLLGRAERGLLNFMGEVQGFLWGTATQRQVDQLHSDIGSTAWKFNEFSNESHKYMEGLAHNISAYSVNLSNVVETGVHEIEQEITNTQTELENVELVLTDVTNMLILNQHIQSVTEMMNSIAADCRNNLVPRSVISDDFLNGKLLEVNQILSENGYTSAATLNQIFNLKLAKCFFSTDELTIIIDIPIKRSDDIMNLFKIIHTPFSYKDNECELVNAPLYVAQLNNQMIPITKDIESLCLFLSDPLCMIPEGTYEPSDFSQCATALAASEQLDIVQKCTMKCQKATTVRIKALSSQHFLVTNSNKVTIRCDDEDDSTYSLQKNVGAILLRLPCKCNADIFDHFKDEIHVVKSSWPCAFSNTPAQTTVVHVLPPQMAHLESEFEYKATHVSTNLSEYFNDKWQFQVPTLTVEPPKKIQFSAAFITNQMQNKVNRNNTLFYVGMAVLAGAVLALGFVVYTKLKCGNNGGGNGFNLVPFMVLFFPGNVVCTDYNDDVSVDSSMWSILQKLEIGNVVVNGIVMAFLIYVMVVLLNAFKTLRLANRMLRAFNNGELIN